MTIVKKVEAVELSVPLNRVTSTSTRNISARDFTLVRIETDDGIAGTGVVYNHVGEIVNRNLAPKVLGADELATEKSWWDMYHEVYRDRKGAAIRALSAVDIALWDAKAKTLKLPLYKLLGARREKVPCYGSGGYYRKGQTLEELADEVHNFLKRGLKAVKIRVGGQDLKTDVERVRAVREAIGSDTQLMLDANNAYDVSSAIKAGKAFQKFDITWFEEPVWPDDLSGSAEVAAALDVPVASGELEYTKYGFRDLIERRAVDIIQPDAEVVGGISEWMKVASMASAFRIPVAPHWAQEVHVHLTAAVDNALFVEWFNRESDIRKEDELYRSEVHMSEGYVIPGNSPGLGVEINEEAIDEFTTSRFG
jgi:D-arabinonate dehydratase